MIGELIGAAGSLLGGLFGQSSARSAQRQQMQLAQQQMAMQREFAQQGVRWRVEDAKAAGVHPLFALGAQTHSFTPQSVGISADNSMGDAIASAGQSLGRAAQAGMSSQERDAATALTTLQLEKAGLENELLRTEIVGKKRAQLGPAMPSLASGGALAGQGDAIALPKPGTARNYETGLGVVRANPSHSQQDDISKEYGDEGLPQLPGQLRFIYDTLKSFGIDAYERQLSPDVAGSIANIIAGMQRAESRALTDRQRRRNWSRRGYERR